MAPLLRLRQPSTPRFADAGKPTADVAGGRMWDDMGYHGILWASMEPDRRAAALPRPPGWPQTSLTMFMLKEWLRRCLTRGWVKRLNVPSLPNQRVPGWRPSLVSRRHACVPAMSAFARNRAATDKFSIAFQRLNYHPSRIAHLIKLEVIKLGAKFS